MCAGRQPSNPAAPERRSPRMAFGRFSRMFNRNSSVHGVIVAARFAGRGSAVGKIACMSGARA
eukprot:3676391-Prorocentrum_lima.AAC.1